MFAFGFCHLTICEIRLHRCMLILSALQHSEGKYTMTFIHPAAYMPSESTGSGCYTTNIPVRVSAGFGKRIRLEVLDFQSGSSNWQCQRQHGLPAAYILANTCFLIAILANQFRGGQEDHMKDLSRNSGTREVCFAVLFVLILKAWLGEFSRRHLRIFDATISAIASEFFIFCLLLVY